MAQLVVIGLIVLAALGLRRCLRNTALARYSARTQSLIGLGALLLLLLIFTGRLGALLPLMGAILAAVFALVTRLLPVLVPLLVQHLARWRAYRPAGSAPDGGGASASMVQSRYLRMRLQHATGELDGEILEGPHAGQTLNMLKLPELAKLYQLYARSDPESARLLAAYLERVHGDHWQAGQGSAPHGAPAAMDTTEALGILGLTSGATREEIIAAHRRLIQKLHPDRGGTDYLAAKINQAKDLLLDD